MKLKHCSGKVPWGKTCKSLGLALPAITLTAVFGMAVDGYFHDQMNDRLRTATAQIAQNRADICATSRKDQQLTSSLVSRSIASQKPEAAPFYMSFARLASGLTGYTDKREAFVGKIEKLAEQGIGVCFSRELEPGAAAASKTIYLDPDAKYEFADTVFLNGLKAFETGQFDNKAGTLKNPPQEKAGQQAGTASTARVQGFTPQYTAQPLYYYGPGAPRWR